MKPSQYAFSTMLKRAKAIERLLEEAVRWGAQAEADTETFDDEDFVTLTKGNYTATVYLPYRAMFGDNSMLIPWNIAGWAEARFPEQFGLLVSNTDLNTSHFRKATTHAADLDEAIRLLRRGFSVLEDVVDGHIFLSPDRLPERRRQDADEICTRIDFGYIVKDLGAWEQQGNVWSRILYFEPAEEEDTPSLRGSLEITFAEGCYVVEAGHALGPQGNLLADYVQARDGAPAGWIL